MSDMPDEIYAIPYTEKTDKESPDWWHSSWGPDGKNGTKYVRADQLTTLTAENERLKELLAQVRKSEARGVDMKWIDEAKGADT